ncbi:uncharacterized protein TNCV_5024371 [Trichonephila clavipes]|nr:uncharacterized protein TNCV_5024371 [Trichonephila clavipes]
MSIPHHPGIKATVGGMSTHIFSRQGQIQAKAAKAQDYGNSVLGPAGCFVGGLMPQGTTINSEQPATVGNAVKGFKKCGIENHNPLVFSEHDFAASKATDHDVVDDEIENNSANPQTLVVENQLINPPEEPEHMANADYDALKKPRRGARESKKEVKKLKLSSCKPMSIKSRPNSPVASTSKDGVIRCPACEEEYCDPPTEEWIQCCKCQE